MAQQEEPLRQKVQHRIEELKRLRDEIQVDLRLATMELRDEWQNLERKLPDPGAQIRGATSEALDRLTSELQKFRARLQQRSTSPGTIPGVMSRPVITCRATDSVAQALTVMWERDVGFLPVLDADGRLVGTLTDRDAAIAAATRAQRPDEIPVDSVMARQLATCALADTPAQVLALMTARQVRRVPVVEDGRPVGVVTLTDLARLSLHLGERGAAPKDIVETLVAVASRPGRN